MKKSTSPEKSERLKEAERILEEDEQFSKKLASVNSGENNANLDNVLASSIQRAK